LISGGTLKADGDWTLTSLLATNWVEGTFESANIITNSGYLTIGGGNYIMLLHQVEMVEMGKVVQFTIVAY
jgi:hypothetical protein